MIKVTFEKTDMHLILDEIDAFVSSMGYKLVNLNEKETIEEQPSDLTEAEKMLDSAIDTLMHEKGMQVTLDLLKEYGVNNHRLLYSQDISEVLDRIKELLGSVQNSVSFRYPC